MKQPLSYARNLERFVANVVDSLILILPAAIMVTAGGTDSALAVAGPFIFNAAYYIAFTASRWQATPGKRLLNLYVARLDGKPLNERDALERFLAYSIPTLPLYLSIAPPQTLGTITLWLMLIWFIPILQRKDRRGVHDLLCGTYVLQGKK